MAIPTASLVVVILYFSPVLSVFHLGLSWPDTACLLGFMVCSGSFVSCGENHPYLKSGWDLDPKKPGWIMPFQGDETHPYFHKSQRVGCRVYSSATPP